MYDHEYKNTQAFQHCDLLTYIEQERSIWCLEASVPMDLLF